MRAADRPAEEPGNQTRTMRAVSRPDAEPGELLSRRWLWLVAAVALTLSFAQSPGQISPDTKLDLTANPLRLDRKSVV